MRHFPRLGRIAALALVATLAGGFAAPARAELRVGYIDSNRIFSECTAAREAQQRFDRQVQGWRDEAAEKERAVSTLRQEVRDQSPILSALKRQEKEQALQNAIRDYEQFIQEIWGPSGRAQQENDNATRDIVNQIRTVVEKLAAERGLGLVLDSSGGFILYAERTMDITTDVVTELNTRAANGGPR